MVSLFANPMLSNKQVFFLYSILYMFLFQAHSGSALLQTVPFVVIAANNENEEAPAAPLIKWKLSLENQSQHVLSSRVVGGISNHYNWVGVGCDGSRSIIHLNLSSFGLNGTFRNLSFSSFAATLTCIDFQKNFHGQIPISLYHLTKLTHLDLGTNRFSGFLSPAVGNLTCLSYIRLSEESIRWNDSKRDWLVVTCSKTYV